MNRKNFLFIIGIFVVIFSIALSSIYFLYSFEIEKNRKNYENELKKIEQELNNNKKNK